MIYWYLYELRGGQQPQWNWLDRARSRREALRMRTRYVEEYSRPFELRRW